MDATTRAELESLRAELATAVRHRDHWEQAAWDEQKRAERAESALDAAQGELVRMRGALKEIRDKWPVSGGDVARAALNATVAEGNKDG